MKQFITVYDTLKELGDDTENIIDGLVVLVLGKEKPDDGNGGIFIIRTVKTGADILNDVKLQYDSNFYAKRVMSFDVPVIKNVVDTTSDILTTTNEKVENNEKFNSETFDKLNDHIENINNNIDTMGETINKANDTLSDTIKTVEDNDKYNRETFKDLYGNIETTNNLVANNADSVSTINNTVTSLDDYTKESVTNLLQVENSHEDAFDILNDLISTSTISNEYDPEDEPGLQIIQLFNGNRYIVLLDPMSEDDDDVLIDDNESEEDASSDEDTDDSSPLFDTYTISIDNKTLLANQWLIPPEFIVANTNGYYQPNDDVLLHYEDGVLTIEADFSYSNLPILKY
jgi:uncharacterized protein YukE